MKIGAINHYTYSNSVTNNQNISHKRGFDTLNKVNPIAHYLDDYFTRMAKFSSTKLEPIIDTLVGKIKPINIKNRRINLLAWDINPNCSNKYVLFLHGMSQNISNYQKLYSEIVKDKSWGVLALEYRGYGENKSGKVSEDKLSSDVEKSLEFLINDKKIDAKNIVVIGHSMGGALAAGIATKYKDLKALILICPITGTEYIGKKFSENNNVGIGIPPKIIKLTEKIKPLQWLYELKFNTINKIKKIKSPIYLIHSTNDQVTSTKGAEKICEIAKKYNIPTEEYYIDKGGHKVDNRKIQICVDILKKLND